MRHGGTHQLFSEINGVPTYVETLQSTGAAATSSALRKGGRYMVQSDAAVYLKLGSTSDVGNDGVAITAVTAANGLKLAADEKFYFNFPDQNLPIPNLAGYAKIQSISVTGTTNLKIFRMD